MKKQNWNKGWYVWEEDNAFKLINVVPKDAKQVDLPYDSAFHRPQLPDTVNMGKTAFIEGGNYNFAKHYFAPSEDRGSKTILCFDGCATKTYVYVNDSMVGECDYPYMEFYVDISSYLKYGQDNLIRVVTISLDPASRFYCGGGIYRDIHMLKGREAYLAPEKLRITTKQIDADEALIQIDAGIVNCEHYSQEVCLKLEIKDKEGNALFEDSLPVHLHADAEYQFSKMYYVSKIIPWNEFTPEMYTCEAQIRNEEGVLLDADAAPIGFRVVTVDAKHGLRINGEEVKLLGGCIHHDQGILGSATYYDYEYRRIKKHKEAGFNAVRSTHYPASKALLWACDTLGVYILDETFDMWARMKNTHDFALFFGKTYKQVIETMVQVDYNHPSVIMYSTGNEIMDIASDKGFELCAEMTKMLHGLDYTRPVTNALNVPLAAGNRLIEIAAEQTGIAVDQIMKMDVNQFISEHRDVMGKITTHPIIDKMLEYLDGALDVSGYNYLVERYDSDIKRYPNRIILGTETHAKRIADHYRLMKEHKAVIGDFIWTSYSYIGETGGAQNFPRLQNESCDMDIIGEKMPTWYYRAVVLGQRKEPYIAVRTPEKSEMPSQCGPWSLTDAIHCWDYPGREGKECDIEVYSGGEEVELFINGKSCGRKPASGELECRTLYRIAYEPGELKAVSYQNGEAVSEYILSTKGEVTDFVVTREENPVGELAFFHIQAVNAKGEPVYAKIDDLHIEINGKAELLGFGSYETPYDCGYDNDTIQIVNGTALAILKKLEEDVSVTVSAKSLNV